ncbi:MAG: hypothetical protein KAU36_06160 [candidate division Zixibacteria bacterium]|nr:hypothetical protein [candidate division Zixibacteria bacterium]
MKKIYLYAIAVVLLLAAVSTTAQESERSSLYDVPPRSLVDVPTAGTLPRAHFDIGFRLYPNGGAIGSTDIGLSHRLMLGISFGGNNIISNTDPDWNPRIEFNIKFRVIDELELFPAITTGFSSQGFGAWSVEFDRYTFKSRGFYAVASRSFYFYNWVSGWHLGMNHSLENDVDDEKDINFFAGVDATFNYNLALLLEYDVALNDDRSSLPDGRSNSFGGKGRGYLNLAVKWLFTENLEIEALMKDLLINRRESDTFTREIRLTYIDKF